MTPPDWFPIDNFWRSKNAKIIASGGGSHHGCVTVPFFSTTGQFCGCGAAVGEVFPSPGVGPGGRAGQLEPPHIAIRGGHYEYGGDPGRYGDYGVDHIGGHSLNSTTLAYGIGAVAGVVFGTDGVVNLVEQDSDTWWYGPVPPYDDKGMDYIRLLCDVRYDTWQPEGVPTWSGEYYLELYELTYEMTHGEPGFGGDDFAYVACPPRPDWPYREPVQSLAAPNSAQIRRSRP